MRTLILVLDLIGTFVFGLSGAAAAVECGLDLFGVLVLSFTVGGAGGVIRDVIIGAIPPAAFSEWLYLAVAVLAGLFTFYCYPIVMRMRNPVLLLDAAGLGLFVVAGTQKALTYGLHPFAAALLGMLTGIGGGVIRDVLLSKIPAVLRTDIYALAGLAGALIVIVGTKLNLSPIVIACTGVFVCFGLRVLAMQYHWHLPVAKIE
jgi:uncharacterized membrane protein YeiH